METKEMNAPASICTIVEDANMPKSKPVDVRRVNLWTEPYVRDKATCYCVNKERVTLVSIIDDKYALVRKKNGKEGFCRKEFLVLEGDK